MRAVLFTTTILAGSLGAAEAQSSSGEKDWKFTIYPVLAWVPMTIDVDVAVPPVEGGGSGGSGKILESRFDGAFFGGVSASNGTWRIEGYGMWAAFGGDRPELPFLVVDIDVLYADAKIGRRIAPDLFITAGVRRLAFEYDVTIADVARLSRKPGFWDPVIGLGWHRIGPKVEWHASFDGGGFGVGTDVDLGASFRVDWKPLRVFGLTAGYNYLYLKTSDTVAGREITLKPTLHGPIAGLGFYF